MNIFNSFFCLLGDRKPLIWIEFSNADKPDKTKDNAVV